MADSSPAALEIADRERPALLNMLRAVAHDFLNLTKPEVNFLIVIAACTGFYLGYPDNLSPFPFEPLLHTLCGTLLVASGAGALNQYLEYDFDARMRRTFRRPVADGRLCPSTARWFGISLSAVGAVYLLVAVNLLASLLAVLTLTSYLFVYTPLKRKTPWCTLVGAFPGAMPPLIGWAAASGSIGGKAWILYAVLFLWQFPHFMAIAWMYREDYARAGYLILPAKGEGTFLMWLTLAPSFGLFIASLAAVSANRGSIFQLAIMIILSSGLLHFAVRQVLRRSRIAARQLLKASIIYLPLEFLILVLGRR
jgi:protoheme IX farnesyltransferase